MLVAELIAELQKLPQDLFVFTTQHDEADTYFDTPEPQVRRLNVREHENVVYATHYAYKDTKLTEVITL